MMVTLKRIAASDLWNNNNTPSIEISGKYFVYKQFMAASALLKNTGTIDEWMVATKETKKHCSLKKNIVSCD